MSGTVKSAPLAAQEFPSSDIRVIDTRTIGSPLASLVQLAAEWSSQGEDAESIERLLKRMIPCSQIYFLVDMLEYLAKGGWIGGATALFGIVLKIKPILDLSEGRVEQYEKERTQNMPLIACLSSLILR